MDEIQSVPYQRQADGQPPLTLAERVLRQNLQQQQEEQASEDFGVQISAISLLLSVLTLAAVFVMAFIVQGVTDVKILRILLSVVIGIMGLAILSCIYMMLLDRRLPLIALNLFLRIPLYSVVLVSAIVALVEAKQISRLKSSTRQLFSVARIISYILLAPLILVILLTSMGMFLDQHLAEALFKGSVMFWALFLPVKI